MGSLPLIPDVILAKNQGEEIILSSCQISNVTVYIYIVLPTEYIFIEINFGKLSKIIRLEIVPLNKTSLHFHLRNNTLNCLVDLKGKLHNNSSN